MNTNKDLPAALAVAGILVVLLVLFLAFGHLRHEREGEAAQWTGQDELSRSIRTEAEEYGLANRNQQLAVLAVGAAVVLTAGAWWAAQRRREPK